MARNEPMRPRYSPLSGKASTESHARYKAQGPHARLPRFKKAPPPLRFSSVIQYYASYAATVGIQGTSKLT